jgi:hypothetical protein
MPGKLSYPLREIELFSSHWDEDWDIIVEDKDNKKGGEDDEDDEKHDSLKDSDKDHNDKGQNDKPDDKEYADNDDVEPGCKNISKVNGNVVQPSIDQHVNATSQLGVQPSSSPAKPRRRHRFPSNKPGSRGMSAAGHVASSPPVTFEIHHNHRPVRGRKSHPTRSPIRK